MKWVVLAGAGLCVWACAAHAEVTPAIAELKAQFETIATRIDDATDVSDAAFMGGDEDEGCASLKDALADYVLAAGVLAQIRAAVTTGGSAFDQPQSTELAQIDATIAKYQTDEADTRDTVKIACE